MLSQHSVCLKISKFLKIPYKNIKNILKSDKKARNFHAIISITVSQRHVEFHDYGIINSIYMVLI